MSSVIWWWHDCICVKYSLTTIQLLIALFPQEHCHLCKSKLLWGHLNYLLVWVEHIWDHLDHTPFDLKQWKMWPLLHSFLSILDKHLQKQCRLTLFNILNRRFSTAQVFVFAGNFTEIFIEAPYLCNSFNLQFNFTSIAEPN